MISRCFDSCMITNKRKMKLRLVNIKEKKTPALRVPDDLDTSLTAIKHEHLTKPARLFILLLELYGRGSIENQALENEEHSRKHPKARNRNKHPKSKTKRNPNSKTKHWKLKNEPPNLPLEDRFDHRQRANLLLLIRIKINFLLKIIFLLFLTISLSLGSWVGSRKPLWSLNP